MINPPSAFRLILGLLVIATSSSVFGREFAVRTTAELVAALESAGSGDVVTLAKGNWTDVDLEINRGGSLGRPLEIRAEVPGETILNGASKLSIKAPFVTVDGLFFYGGAIKKGAVIEFKSHHGIIRNTAIVDYNPSRFETGYYWVFFSGDDNLLDRCYFKGKNNLSPLIGNAIDDSRRNTVRSCFFKAIPYVEANGREGIRVWGAGKFDATAENGAYFTIEGNLFDHADGEGTEIISLKSNHNRVLNNTVIATLGCINIRQGSSNLVEGNVILGQGRAGTQGLRMSGLNNIVQGNYVSNCDFGIRVSSGEYVTSALTPAYAPKQKIVKGQIIAEGPMATYPQVKNLTLSNNVTVGIKGADLEVGFSYKRRWPEEQMVLIPEMSLFQNNRFVRPRGGDSVIGTIPDTQPPLDQFSFEPNRYEGNELVGGENAFALATDGLKTEPLPVDWTEAGERKGFRVLRPNDVGPAWVVARRDAGRFPMEAELRAKGEN